MILVEVSVLTLCTLFDYYIEMSSTYCLLVIIIQQLLIDLKLKSVLFLDHEFYIQLHQASMPPLSVWPIKASWDGSGTVRTSGKW